MRQVIRKPDAVQIKNHVAAGRAPAEISNIMGIRLEVLEKFLNGGRAPGQALPPDTGPGENGAIDVPADEE